MYRACEWLYERIRRDRRADAAVSVRAFRLTFEGTLVQTGTDSYRLKAIETERRTTRRP
ncbi:hypothetical protein AB5J72_24100 [Streptomyces sp. CG1]|uniref:hypothetical protein n=1 Tax=Streptomyces sp. CG1 TaxID=1287523 RepID=UPI0034E2547F